MILIDKILFILYVAFIGADRINLFPDVIDLFTFTPNLILSLIFCIYISIFKINKINFKWIYNNKYFPILICLFLLSILLSIFFSINFLFSFKRFILLIIVIIIPILILSTYTKENILNFLYKGSIYGSLLYYFFNILLFLTWISIIDLNTNIVNLNPDSIGTFIPRLGGFCLDVNRGTFILIFYTYILITLNKSSFIDYFIISMNSFFILCSLSRTGILFFIIALLLYLLFYSEKFNKRKLIFMFCTSLLVLFFSLTYLSKNNIIDIDATLEERLSFENNNHDSSSSIHLKLLKDGFEEVLKNSKVLLVGNGHGTSYKLIKGYKMSRDKNANYHSQYLSILVENGIFAFIFFLCLSFLYPLFYLRNNIYLPLLVGTFMFNIFYQLINEPTFWFMILFFYFYTCNIKYKINNENIH